MPTPDPGSPLQFTFIIPADHPSLAGHFPGEPVVPGVVVLDHVLAQLAWPMGAPRRLAWVKFTRALLPEQAATATLSQDAAGWRFTVARGGDVLVQGMLAPLGHDRRVEA
jgi:3-hydroxymyristoyl/3-hydroxydecanoyl-(acyl carrier protein) dehydratase